MIIDDSETLYAAAHAAVEDAMDVLDAVIRIRNIYKVDHVTYHLGQLPAIAVDGPYVKSTYPGAWLSTYLIKGYTRVDPVVIEGFARVIPFDWRELVVTPRAMEVFADFVAHGLGGVGFSVPILDKLGRRALFSINTKTDEASWDAFLARHHAKFSGLAYRLHEKAMSEVFEDMSVPQLSPRELECLRLASFGKSAKEIAIEVGGLSDRTVETYLRAARDKLGAENTLGAVAKAIKLRLINI